MIALQMQIARENAKFAEPDPAFPPVFDDYGDEAAFCHRIAKAAAERALIFCSAPRERRCTPSLSPIRK